MEYIFVWALLAVGVGLFGMDKIIGFWGGFLWSLLLSPVIGAIIVILSKSKSQKAIEDQMMYNQQQQTQILKNLRQPNQSSISDELLKLKKLLDDQVITQEEYQKMKNKIIAQFD